MVNSTLSNFAGVTLDAKVKLPPQGTTGNIRILIGKDNNPYGYGVKDGNFEPPGKDAMFAAGTEVGTLQPLIEGDIRAQWEIGMMDSSGYFTIKNPHSGKFLTGFTADKLTIEGKYVL